MTVNPNGIIKGFNVLEYKSIGMFIVNDIESVKPLSLIKEWKDSMQALS